MCLAIPAQVETIANNNESAVVNIGGIRKTISLALLDDVAIGDYVLVHVGFALNKISEAEAQITLQLFSEAGAFTGERQ